VATLLRLGVESYWRTADAFRWNRLEAARLACELYRLGNAVLYGDPKGGWEDEHLTPAGGTLLAFGDLHAVLSIDWPDGCLPQLGWPDRQAFGRYYRASGLATWVEAFAEDIGSVEEWAHDYRRLEPGRGSHARREASRRTVAALRLAERPDAPGHERWSRDAAQYYGVSKRLYKRLYRTLHADPTGARFARAEESRRGILIALSWGRLASIRMRQSGAAAEAILAADRGTRVMRDAYLMASTRSQAELADLLLLSPRALRKMADRDGLNRWAEQLIIEWGIEL
jgi:hypothetical protein